MAVPAISDFTLYSGTKLNNTDWENNFQIVVNYLTDGTESITIKAIESDDATINDDATVGGTLDITGDTTVGGTLDVTGNITTSGSVRGFGVIPVGGILPYGGATAPTGYLLCDGTSYDTTTYATLYAVIGYTFGGAAANFNVPDMRGVFPKGAGTTSRALGKDASGNFYAGTLGTYATDKMQGHYHTGMRLSQQASTFGSGYLPSSGSGFVNEGTAAYVAEPYTDGTNNTPRTGHTTEPQSLGLTYIIRYE